MRMTFYKIEKVFGWSATTYRVIFCVTVFALLTCFNTSLYAQNAMVRGRVLESNGQPIPSASVKLKGSRIGVSTDMNGNFQLSAPSNGKLEVSSVGFITQEISINGRANVVVALTSDTKSLDEVVVIGFGTQRKRDVTGSVVSASGSTLKEVPAANMQQALQGRLSGVEVQSVGTRPGAGAQIRIRGERSINAGNDPLIVLDNIPFNGNLNDINPDDIASVDVLKDASATAIYGSRGANGVILISTKRGAVGDTKVSLNSYYGLGDVVRKYPVYNADQYRALRDYSVFNQDYTLDEKQGITSGRNTDWQDLVYKTSMISDNNVTVGGGNEKSQFSVGSGFFKQTAVLPGQDYQRATLRATGDFNVGKHVRLGVNSMNNYSTAHGSQSPMNVFPLLTLSPLSSPYNPDGSINIKPAGNQDDFNTTYNPLLVDANPDSYIDRVRRFRSFNSLYAQVNIASGLRYRVNVGLDFQSEEGGLFQGTDSYFRPGTHNVAQVNNSTQTKYSIDNLLYYEKVFNKKHRLNVTGLFGFEREQYHNTNVRKEKISADFVKFYNLGQASSELPPVLGGGEWTASLVQMMLRATYVYDDRYMITLTGRRDGSSRLAEGNKFKQYPAVSAGWTISNEEFMKPLKFISNLKLRAGFGTTANQAIAAYQTLGGLSNINAGVPGNPQIRYNYGTTVANGYYVSRIVDKNLDWEYTRTTNVGLDFGFFGSRITGSVEYYTAKTTKLLYGVGLPPTSGITEPYVTNIGGIKNSGMEFSISSENIRARKFRWSTDLNFYFNRNKLESLNGSITQVIANQLFVGQPLTAIFDYKKLGIWQQNEVNEAAKYGFVPGQLKLEDHNQDGAINANDKYVIGDGQAKLQGGITNRFVYGDFDFTFVLYGRWGGTLISQVHQPLSGYATINDGRRNQLAVDYWTPTNPTNFFPSPNVAGGLITSPLASDAQTVLGYYDASFLKVRTISLGYSVKPKWINKVGAKNLRVYVSSQNPFILFSPYVKHGGVDPEPTGLGNQGVSNPGNISNRALTIGVVTPPTRSVLAGLNVTF